MVSPAPNIGRRCPSGRHVMDPNWEFCPYCDGEKRSREQTAYRTPDPVLSSDTRKTSIGESIPNSQHRETKPMPFTPAPNYGGYGGRGDKRRIMGILISYTWHPQGDLFPIREGKNYIGAGTVSREPGDHPCDILIADDAKLSSAHALILCRQGIFEIVDQESSNGTFINEKMVPIRGMELPDSCTLRTGDTVWTFMKIALGDSPAINTVPPLPEQDETVEAAPGRSESPSKTIVR